MIKRKNVPVSEQRLILLDALAELGGVTELQLLRFMVESDLMDYFTFKLELSALEESDQVRQASSAQGTLLTITEEGRYVLSAFLRRVPAGRRDCVHEQAERLRGAFRSELERQLDAFPLSEGRQGLRLRLLENDSALMDLSMSLETPQPEHLLRKRWFDHAQDIYGTITRCLSDGYTAGQNEATLPPCVQLHQTGDNEWFLALQDREKDPRMTLLLALPTRDMAAFYASRWPQNGEYIADTVLRDLTED